MHEVGDAELRGELLQALRLGEAAAAGAADDGDEEAAAQRGIPVDQDGDGAQQDVGGLQRLDPPGEERDDGVLRQTEAGAGGGPAVADREAVEVHAGVDDGHLAGVGLVVPDELVGLLGGVRDEPVGGGHDLGLADDAGGRFGVSPSASAAFLTLAMVCMAWTSGTPQRSAASQPTWPESQ